MYIAHISTHICDAKAEGISLYTFIPSYRSPTTHHLAWRKTIEQYSLYRQEDGFPGERFQEAKTPWEGLQEARFPRHGPQQVEIPGNGLEEPRLPGQWL